MAAGTKRALSATKESAKRIARGSGADSTVLPERVRHLNDKAPGTGPVVYWMSRDQRVDDNWALLYAQKEAQARGEALVVAFSLVQSFLQGTFRQFAFMIRGLRELEAKCTSMGIPFVLLRGSPADTVPKLDASMVVCDMSPLRIGMDWRTAIGERSSCAVRMVDAHNIVPVWEASPKLEYAARTIRSKIHHKLHKFLTPFPEVEKQDMSVDVIYRGSKVSGDAVSSEAGVGSAIDWDGVLASLEVDRGVPEVTWLEPGEVAASRALDRFLSSMKGYDSDRNDPTKNALSNLSPYFHFGQLAPQRAAIAATGARSTHKEDADAFLEELIIRRELADNFCWYNQGYDNLATLYPNFNNESWAQKTLQEHRDDPREHTYTRDQLEQARTHDRLWNAMQKEMVLTGKMHGWCRMYWAKKILEWTATPEEALEIGIFLNDKYSLDGRDPNGYVGVAWSVAGVHDQGWKERPIFGKIRYMNDKGAKRKFNVEGYISKIARLERS